ncbi:hypothetical protein BDZ91DRAFT_641353, partial [Kalaharituber pfeilii]
ISPLEPQKGHQAVREIRVANTGKWVLQSKQFQSWMKGEPNIGGIGGQVLACYGEPGAGKTFIASTVVDYICTQSNTRVAYIDCDYRDGKEQSLINIIGAFIK